MLFVMLQRWRVGGAVHRGRRSLPTVVVLCLAALLFTISPASVSAGPIQKTDSLTTAIDSLLSDSTFANCFLGISIVAVDDGTTLFARNDEKLFHPASNQKLFTTAAALHLLPAGFQFTTQAEARGIVKKGVLQGDLIVRGSGDPTVTTTDLDSLALRIRARGIKTVAGDLVGDAGRFDSVYWGHGWMWDDEPDPDEAFISPLTVNGNSVKVVVHAGRRRGSRPSVTVEEVASFLSVRNLSVTSYDTTLPPLLITRQPHVNTVDVEGRISPGTVHETKVSVWRPEIYFLRLFRQRLAAHGVRINGRIRLASQHGSRTVGTIVHSIDTVLRKINKESDNLGAENLLKTIAAEKRGEPGSSADGLTLVRAFASSRGIDTSHITLSDASGVSWYNSVSPAEFTKLLLGEYRVRDTFERFRATLPVAGIDGTLANRMIGSRAEGNARAKTGTLTGVSALSGYITAADGTPLAFSILCNHFRGELAPLRTLQDSILTLLANYRRPPK